MIDTHLHVLPGVDDGPQTMEESIALAKTLVQEGIRAAIATPHFNDLYPQYCAAEIQERVGELQQVLDEQKIPLHLFAGHEALIRSGLLDDIRAGRLATLNGSRYLLLELWNDAWLPATEQVIFELCAAGIAPILAHPERYRILQREQGRLAALLRQGVLVQITASSLLGIQGRTAQRVAETLLREGMVHCIASDSHGLHHRPPAIAQSLEQVARLVGQEKMRQLVEDNPMMILHDKPLRA